MKKHKRSDNYCQHEGMFSKQRYCVLDFVGSLSDFFFLLAFSNFPYFSSADAPYFNSLSVLLYFSMLDFFAGRKIFTKKNTGRFSILNFNIRILWIWYPQTGQRCKKQKSKSDIITYYSRYCRGNYFFWNAFPYPDFFFIPCFNFVYGLSNVFLILLTAIVVLIFNIQHAVFRTGYIDDICFHDFDVCICFIISYGIDYEKYDADQKGYCANKLNKWKVFSCFPCFFS